MAPTRLLIVDDAEEARCDLRTALTLTGEIEIIGEAANGAEAIRLTEALRPDVVLMDLEMPLMDGIEATRRIKADKPACRVVILTVHDSEVQRKQAEEAGAGRFMIKGVTIIGLVKAIIG